MKHHPHPSVPADRAGGTSEPRYLTASEIAALLRVKVATVNAWARGGHFTGAFSLGKSGWRIPVDGLETFRRRRATGGSAGVDILPAYDTAKFRGWRKKAV